MDDLISRQAAVKEIKRIYRNDKPMCLGVFDWEAGMCRAIEIVMGMPPAQSERKKGKWIYQDFGGWHCSECGKLAPFWCFASTQQLSNFCPNCGADMREGSKDDQRTGN